MWSNRPVGHLEKCAEAGALRRAFPDEIGNALTAEEMEGQHAIDGAAHAPEKPKPESGGLRRLAACKLNGVSPKLGGLSGKP
jgi:RecT family